jgi:glutamate 5-kinase
VKELIYRRIVVKAGTQVLTGGSSVLVADIMSSVVRQMCQLHAQGIQIILVTSGAMTAGREVLGLENEDRDVPFRQVLAAVGQGRLMRIYEELFSSYGVSIAQALLTRGDLNDRQGYLNVRNTLTSLLELGVVPVVNENDVVAVEEIGQDVFGDNDKLSAMVSNLVDADLLIILSDIAGLYTADPHIDTKAHLISRVEKVDASIEALAGKYHNPRSKGGMGTKLEAAKATTAFGIPVIIAHGQEPDIVVRLAQGEVGGTFFAATSSKLESRKRWMLSGLSNRGEIWVDLGAGQALISHNRSLLAAGITDVRGDFRRGDIVYILDRDGQRLACGISNYGSTDIEYIKGTRSTGINALLGYQYGAEVVHRNNMVML